jgi:hypothetical protein
MKDDIVLATKKAVTEMSSAVPKSLRLAIMNIQADEKDIEEFVFNELEVLLIQEQYRIVDRVNLDVIRIEQSFQYSGEVDDRTAVSIGKFAGADVIILGSITGSGDLRRLRIRALNTSTADVMFSTSVQF